MNYDIWYSLVKLDLILKLKLLKIYKSTERIWNYLKTETPCLLKDDQNETMSDNCEKKLLNILKKTWDEDLYNRVNSIIIKNDIKVINYFSDCYPKKLRNFDDSPSILYFKGDIEKLNDKVLVSIVGSRNCSYYGKNVASTLSKELSLFGFGIVSGLAKGIDTCAHGGCLEGQGFTCGVLGNGIDIIYPKENSDLYEKILNNNGCIISEFPPGTMPYKSNFPIRNRIISGLSEFLLVVEAGKKSGTIHTVDYALSQGIMIGVIPGSILSEQSIGTNNLIMQGARPITSVKDILFEMGYTLELKDQVINKNFSKIKRQIYDLIKNIPIHIDDILKSCNVDIDKLYEVLFELQLDNMVISLAGNCYVRMYKDI